MRRGVTKLRRRAAARIATVWYAGWARHGRRPVVDSSASIVVSLTSHGARLDHVHITIESIARGSSLPGRLVLWLDPDQDLVDLPARLRRLMRRGLEVRNSPWAIGPHNKYFPIVSEETPPAVPLVTADDDLIYPRRWLSLLEGASALDPGSVVAHRARTITLDESGALAPYNSWPLARGTRPAFRRFPTGCSGVLYPVRLQLYLRSLGRAFGTACPRADDLWLHHAAVTSGIQARQVRVRPRTYLEVPGTQTQALNHDNTARNENDAQAKATYSERAMQLLRSERTVHDGRRP